MTKNIILIIFSIFLLGCAKDVPQESLFTLLDSEDTNITFSNDLPIELELNIFNYMYYYNGGGIAVADFNNDDLTDILFTSNLGAEAFYLNKGNLEFEDISSEVKIDGGPNSWTNGAAVADVNGDGLLDIYLSQVGTYRSLDCKSKLFICSHIDSNGTPHYEEQAEEYGLDFKGFSTQAGFFDYDLDGDLDMYLMNHSLHHNGTFGKRSDFIGKRDSISGDRLFRNDNNKFTDVTTEAGIYSTVIGYGLGLAFGDVNWDGYPDIYVGNDFHENDYLYINQGDGTFKEDLVNQMKHTSRFSMGVDIADINNDKYPDIVSLDMLPEDPFILKSSEGEDALDIFNFKLRYGYNHQYARNALQLNQGNGTFKEIGAYAQIHATDWSWSPLFFDMNMDGYKDLFISNGIPKRMNDIDYINFISGNDIQFKIQFDHLEDQDLSALEKIPEIKLFNKFYLGNETLIYQDMENSIVNHQISYSNSAAYADFDNDGDYDLVCNNIDQKAFIYENSSVSKPVCNVKLKGPEKNRFAVGSKVIAHSKGQDQLFEYFPTKGFQSSMINQILVASENLDSVVVIWPDGKYVSQKYQSEEEILFEYHSDLPEYNRSKPDNSDINIFADITQEKNIDYQHKENPFVEFNREPLIPFSTSADGPALAVADVNNDGLEDFFVGSSKRKRNQLYIQQKDGSFTTQVLEGIPSDTIYEEVDAVFTDIDNDGDQDLIIATGGNEYRLNSPYTQPLLYINERGNLIRDEEAFSAFNLTASCIAVHDIDGDGFQDIFFGGRAVPWSYGETPNSFLLKNSGKGTFEDVTDQWSEELSQIGFVRDAQWTDMDQDGDMDLVLALEWDKIIMLEREDNRFTRKALSDLHGWWNCLLIEDFDNDGDKDIFAGNLGLNSRLKANKDKNVKLYYNDFDDNKVSEQILSYFVKDREMTFSNMMELQKQIPVLKKEYLYAEDFARSSIDDLFGKDKVKNSKKYYANHFENTLLINRGNNDFDVMPLPKEAQFTSYITATAVDVNGDGFKDIIPGGNYHYCNVQMGRYDAENGSVLINEEGKKFTFKNLKDSPLPGQARKMEIIHLSQNDKALLVAQNNDSLKLLKFREDFE